MIEFFIVGRSLEWQAQLAIDSQKLFAESVLNLFQRIFIIRFET